MDDYIWIAWFEEDVFSVPVITGEVRSSVQLTDEVVPSVTVADEVVDTCDEAGDCKL